MFRELGDGEHAAAAAFEQAALLLWIEGDHARIARILREADAVYPHAPPTFRARLLIRLGGSTAIAGELDEGWELMDQGVQLAEASGDPLTISMCDGVRGSARWHFLKLRERIPAMERSMETAIATGRRSDFAWSGGLLSRAYILVGDLARAEQIDHDVIPAAEEVGHVAVVSIAVCDLAQLAWMREPNIDALATSAQCALELDAPPLFREQAIALVCMTRNERDHDPDPARDLVGSTDRSGVTQWRDSNWMTQVWIDADRQPARPRATYVHYASRLPAPGDAAFGGIRIALGTLVEGLATMGMHHEAAALYEALMDVMRDGGVLWLNGTFEGAAAIAGGVYRTMGCRGITVAGNN